ncbi:hypothetical protein BD310DRAFT_929255 [Dichomitus squalens]|uniref:Uncharacterized protein n=1 Tax=Dichomitus squalens TaxID=114155 RepID=A0A4Q9PSV9_9APHY|nr:hypothetical protein BD310DRAFT_929255 [Dichomitus squalens]
MTQSRRGRCGPSTSACLSRPCRSHRCASRERSAAVIGTGPSAPRTSQWMRKQTHYQTDFVDDEMRRMWAMEKMELSSLRCFRCCSPVGASGRYRMVAVTKAEARGELQKGDARLPERKCYSANSVESFESGIAGRAIIENGMRSLQRGTTFAREVQGLLVLLVTWISTNVRNDKHILASTSRENTSTRHNSAA